MIRKTLSTLIFIIITTINAQASWWDKVTGAVDSIKSSAQNEVKVYPQIGYAGSVDALAISNNKRIVISASDDRSIIIWDSHTKRTLSKLNDSAGEIKSLAISPDGSNIISCSDKTIKIWDTQSGNVLHTIQVEEEIRGIAISPDGEKFTDGGKVWDLKSAHEVLTIKANKYAIKSVVYSPDGRHIISANSNNTIGVFDSNCGAEVNTIIRYNNSITVIAVSPDGRTIASGSDDKSIILWDTESGRKLKVLKGHTNKIVTIVFSTDGRTVVSGGYDGLKIWDISSGKERYSLSKKWIRSVVFLGDGHSILCAAGYDGLIEIDTRTSKFLDGFSKDNETITTMVLLNNKHTIVTGGTNKEIKFWDLKNGKLSSILKGHTDGIISLAVSIDENTLVSGSADNTIVAWNLVNAKKNRTFNGDINTLAVTPDGNTIISGGHDNNLVHWDTKTGHKKAIELNAKNIRAVAISPDGKTLASAVVDDQSVTLWDIKSSSKLKILDGNKKHVENMLVFSPNSRIVAAGLADNTIKLWDALNGKEIDTFNLYAYSLAFSNDNKLLVAGCMDEKIRILNVSTGNEIYTLNAGAIASGVAFSSNNNQLIASLLDGSIKIFDTATGKEIVKFVSFSDGEWVTITPEGYYNASENGDKHLNVRTGPNLHDVYGIDQYRESFYRPDLVKLALGGGSLSDMRNIASVKPAPSVEIINTPETTTESEATVTLKMKDMGGGIGDVRLYVNGSAVMLDNSRALKRVSDGTTRTYTLKLSNGKNSIRAIAFNADNSMQSTDALYTITSSFKVASKPNLHAIVVGIQEFKNPKLNLQYPIADAKLFSDTLKQSATGLFNHVEITQLTTREETTSENIKAELSKLKKLNPDDLFVFYVASHGTVDDGEYFLITSNVGLTSTDHLKSDALTQNTLKELIANIPATKKVILLDTCNSGGMIDAMQKVIATRGMSEDTAIKILSRAVGTIILAASTSTQEALEGYKGHGLFTYVLSEGIKGKADKGKTGFIKTGDLLDYVETEVPDISEKVFKRAQYPMKADNGQGFHIGKVAK